MGAQTKQTAHTPTPWLLEDGTLRAAGEETRLVADVAIYGRLSDEGKANAAFIVRACNSHNDLVAALRAIQEIENKEYGPDWEEIEQARQIATDALAKAGAA